MWYKKTILASVGALVILACVSSSWAGIKTWDGLGDGEHWSHGPNWDPDGVPGATDDVFHDNIDVIQFDLGSLSTPYVINSFTVEGSAGGGLFMEAARWLSITGDFNNIDTAAGDRYELTMGRRSILDLEDIGDADLRYVDVTMQAGTIADPTQLILDGEIFLGTFIVNANCTVEVEGGITGSGSTPADWTIDGGEVRAGPSTLWGDWTLTDAAATFDELNTQSNFGVTLLLEDASSLTLVDAPFDVDVPFFLHGPSELVHGDGGNTITAGTTDDSEASNLFFGDDTRITSQNSTGTLTLSLFAELYIVSDFGLQYVHEAWDTRRVDVIARPIEATDVSAQSVELISPNLESSFTTYGQPVIFVDVPCTGAFRDLTLPGQTSPAPLPVAAAHWWNNSAIDEVGTTRLLDASGPPEAGFFRDVTVGAGRELHFFEIAGKIYYHGNLNLQVNGAIYFHPEVGSPFQVTTLTTPAISDLLVPAVLTDYGDWDGDGTVEFSELIELLVALLDDEYDPLFDYDCDGKLSAIEIMALLANWGSCHGDLNSDDQVDLEDLELVVDDYGCTSSCSGDLDDDDDSDVEDLKAWQHLLGCGVSGGYTIGDAMGDLGLDASDWDDFLYHVENGTPAEHDNYLCWMAHYLECHAPSETCNGSTCTNDPFGGH